jgi:predicted alpha/beta-fold hydrolase
VLLSLTFVDPDPKRLKPYSPPFLFFNAHIETIYPSLFRRVNAPPYRRERIPTPDDDFLDLDWMNHPAANRLAILSHGLEGDTHRPYILGMARALFGRGPDVLAWNYRGCSGELNRQRRFYHSGATDDLDTVIKFATASGKYKEIFLVGFSLGGNLTLKYLGEPRTRPDVLKKAVVFSVPLDLYTSCLTISKPGNYLYARRFVKSLKNKVRLKAARRRDLDIQGLDNIHDLFTFDNQYTAPLHGFRDARQYYAECSAVHFLSTIRVPTLIVNAENDPFLSPACFPIDAVMHHPFVRFEIPARGGHVGFTLFNSNGLYWSELRALEFLHP